MSKFSMMRLRAAAVLAAGALALSGCFMSPGKFTAELALTGPDSFTFSYDGEIFFAGLSKLAQMGATGSAAFTANCYDEETYESRDCTAEEEAEQRDAWNAAEAERAAQAKKQAEQMAVMMGGIDPSDPKAADELVKLLQRHRGWERVVHKGGGVFDVSYRVTGTMGHDFTFPMIEGFPSVNPFVQVYLRKGGQIRINAPGFSAQNDDAGGGLGAMMGMGSLAGLAAMGASEAGNSAEAEALKSIPAIDGTFTVRSSPGLRILANNTDEGPIAGTAGEVLTWQINARSKQIPTALITAGR
ncbi:hypothetical protein C0V72_11035 [Porphyrobacter sp. TH134]|uniref:hypothetical protein n=1 Tax=Porphyrobacter sp. TH134 TaxID=2067450 RepID=UPI000C7E7B81|nr:hypothetical protein [Porphyrobacter sp. TH134]PLK23204.1 hypothetical protein C0V72_11035 [Porphyrobacter sp. TH134]